MNRKFGFAVLLGQWSFACWLITVPMSCQRGAAPQRIRLQLNWFPDAQFGGYFAAWLHGEYESEGLDVEIVPGGPGVSVIPKVALGRVEFGVGNADQVLLARQQEGKLVAVMASMQDNPRCIMVHESSGFKSLHDLRDITLAVEEGSAFAMYLRNLAPLTNVRLVSYAGSIARFMSEKDFAQQAYVFSEPVVARQQGSDAAALMLSEVGYNPYAGCIITTEDYIASHPDVVERFVRATCRGWQRYLDDPVRTNTEIHRRNPDMDLDSLREATAIIRGLCLPDGSGPMGVMTEERWQTLANQLRELQLLSLSDEDVARSYALQFVSTNAEQVSSHVPPPVLHFQ